MPAYDGKTKLAFCERLGKKWRDLADYFEIKIGERDCFYERHTNSEGEFTDPDDEEACLMMDRDIDEAATLIARAKGIAWSHRKEWVCSPWSGGRSDSSSPGSR